MHIENVHIHLGGGPLAAAALAAVFDREAEVPEPAPTAALPKVGDRWPGVEGTFVGIARADGDTPSRSSCSTNRWLACPRFRAEIRDAWSDDDEY